MDKKEQKSSGFASLAAGIIGGGIFLFFLLALHFSLLVSALIAVAGFIAGGLLFTPGKPKITYDSDGSITPEVVAAVVKDGKVKTAELAAYSAKISKPEVKKQVLDIAEVVKKIYQDFEMDPKDIKTGRQFINYYLETTMKILGRYVELSGHRGISAEEDASLKKVEDMLGVIKAAFEKQLIRLREDDFLDLDTELSVLEKTIKMEG